MSSVVENRAAVFASQPQVVEVYQAGAWWAGELLGWRHDDTGTCQVWVRAVVDGIEQTTWTDLATLRLPERSPAPQAAPVVAVTQALPAAAPAHDHDTTASLPLKRDHLRRPAPARAGGRRRAPEEADVHLAHASSTPVPAPGRHRASGEAVDVAAGRHRAADTGLFPAVGGAGAEVAPARRDECPETTARPVPSARTALPVEVSSVGRGWTPPADLDGDLLTRPMRLGDQVPHSRRPRVKGPCSSV
ncbi:hypothetical protein [Blastococcus saxobsidens]|uniref:Agenet domain-containing protein n=1 Tax=Blastococcus saxobsidens (strain DD2) TaxID=1146883 RepID=H6RUZ4_BLASD|nr:hypothetical protein [Blastococcus saxobsidens]CCG04516.1 conserved protein of unknown function [Blastococcus saxobsidens DD2]